VMGLALAFATHNTEVIATKIQRVKDRFVFIAKPSRRTTAAATSMALTEFYRQLPIECLSWTCKVGVIIAALRSAR